MTSFPRLSTDLDRLFALDDASLDNRLVELFEASEADPRPIDFDRFMGLGVSFARVGRVDQDRVALDWLAKTRTPRRLDIVSAFLSGIWQPAIRLSGVLPERAEAFITLRCGIKIDDEVAYSSLLPLAQIAVPAATPDVRQRVKQAMQTAAYEAYRDPKVAEQAQELISAALRRLE